MVAMEGPHEKMAVVFGVSLLLVMIVLPVSVSVNYSASNSGYVDGGRRCRQGKRSMAVWEFSNLCRC